MHEITSRAKPKFPRAAAIEVVREVLAIFRPSCFRVIIAGSLRRNKPMVGDIEILFIPHEVVEQDLLGATISRFALTDKALDLLLARGIIKKRLNSLGSETWGEMNKLAVHVQSGIPIDFFRATPQNWYNYLVCRTGPAESNVAIASAAERQGMKWHPYNRGFTKGAHWIPVESERDVFRIAGLPYKDPHER